jgi:hypothetical protein
MPTSSKYKIGRPIQEVRLRKWKGSRVAQFKKVIELLETQLNKTMAAQVEQGERRVISARVPRVVNVQVRSGYKNFQLTFDAAKGFKDLLFYEIQKDPIDSFPDPTTFNIPQTGLTISAPFENQLMNFRVRCINSRFEAGPWSKTASTTSRSFFRIASFNKYQPVVRYGAINPAYIAVSPDGDDNVTDIYPANFDVWTEVGNIQYSPSKGHISVQFHAGAQVSCINHFPLNPTGNYKSYVNDVSVKFRVKRAGVVLKSDGEMNVHAFGYQQVSTPVATLEASRYEQQVYSTLFTKLEAYDGSGPLVTYTIEAKVLKETCASLITGTGLTYNPDKDPVTIRAYDDYVRIIVAGISILEILELS